jgi:hypothetical protein
LLVGNYRGISGIVGIAENDQSIIKYIASLD